MRVAALLCALAACYSPGYKDCEITCGTTGCPSGFECRLGVCRTAGATGACGSTGDSGGIDVPAGDPDGDGLAGAADNCPTKANPDQDNEDGDQFGDVCDPCPPFPGVDNNDDDGDGVGNGCDPNPMTPGDKIFFFEGAFRNAGMATQQGTWTFQSGVVSVNAPQTSPSALLWPGPPPPMPGTTPSFTILARTTIKTMSGSLVGAGTIDLSTDGNSGTACWVGPETSNVFYVRLTNVVSDTALARQQTPFTAGMKLLVDSKRTGINVYKCSVSANSMAFAAPGNSNATVPAAPRAGLWARGVTADFDWVLMITSP